MQSEMNLNFKAAIQQLSNLLPKETAKGIQHFDSWVEFYLEVIGECFMSLSQLEDRAPSEGKQNTEGAQQMPEVDEYPDNSAQIWTIHRFSEENMELIDPVLRAIPTLMRRHPDFKCFEGEEIIASWVSMEGRNIPSNLPSAGGKPQGGYIMHMAGNAQQRAHIHGIRKADGSYVDDTGGRYLLGLFGATNSTIRHPGGSFRVPRGSLVRVHFPQTDMGPTAHQFWNEDFTDDGPGNLFFSFHSKDMIQGQLPEFTNSEMMGRRTYALSNKALEKDSDHGFIQKNVSVKGYWLAPFSTQMNHGPSGSLIETSAPKTSGGDGNRFSPIDLFASSVASCSATAMSLHAKKNGIIINSIDFSVESEVSKDPKKVNKLKLEFRIDTDASGEEYAELLEVAEDCPIRKSIHPEIEIIESFLRK